ncbi:MAG: glycosyltransferase [Planctomycetota bacterium]
MTASLNIVVGGYIVGLPLAGMTWHHLHYLLGLARLGHRVTFLEDSGAFAVPYNPMTFATEADPSYGIAYLRRCFAAVGLEIPWCYVSRHTGPGELTHFGLNERELHDAIKSADLYISVSGVTPWHASRPRPRRTLGIDTDPVYTQGKMPRDAEFDTYWRDFDRRATFGTNLGTPGCDVPTHGLDWFPTRQPIVLDQWPVTPVPNDGAFTTVGQWDHDSDRHVDVAGSRFLSSKAPGWLSLRDLPDRVPASYRPAMSKVPGDVAKAFADRGWTFTDPTEPSLSLDAYGGYIGASLAELTPAKQIYAGSHCGWFSDRSACYLASGRPVVTQSTGFEQHLPTGEGLLAFADIAEAAAAVRTILSDPQRHATAARQIAEWHFDARDLLPTLLCYALD